MMFSYAVTDTRGHNRKPKALCAPQKKSTLEGVLSWVVW